MLLSSLVVGPELGGKRPEGPDSCTQAAWNRLACKELAAALNTLLASRTFASWRQGATLDPAEWLVPEARLRQ